MSRRESGCRPQREHSPALEAGKVVCQVPLLAEGSSLPVLVGKGSHESCARSAISEVEAGWPAPRRQVPCQRVQCFHA